MTKEDALLAMSALGHPRRLDAFKLLVSAAPDGLLAGDIAERLESKQNTMSTNLAVLLRAKLVRARREGRGVRYTADTDTFGALLRFLADDCCGGRLGRCTEVMEAVGPTGPTPAETLAPEAAAQETIEIEAGAIKLA
ncbi:MAG: ArsR/SmtB family transcription factor [Paracoccaceae bacterium]